VPSHGAFRTEPRMIRPHWLLFAVTLLAACDNVGRAFDPGFNGERSGVSNIRAPATGAVVRSQRPRVVSSFPRGGGVANTSPIAVLFSESMNADTLTPTTGGGTTPNPTPTLPNLYLREKDTSASNPGGPPITPTPPVPLAGSYDFLAAGRLVVFRPLQNLKDSTAYEVVVGAGARDLDGTTVDREVITAEFTTVADSATVLPVVVSVFPPDNATDELRETPIYAVFNKAVTAATVTTNSFAVRNHDTGARLTAGVSFPLRSGTQNDTRVVRLEPASALPGGVTIDVLLTNEIMAGDKQLQTNNRDPFSDFRTLAFLAAQAVSVGNPSTGFPNKVNLANIDQLQIQVDLPSTAVAGDQVTVRIYGGDPTTTGEGDVKFVEVRESLLQSGAGTQLVTLGNKLKSGASNLLEDGALTLCARLERGSALSGFVVPDSSDALQDTVRPTLVTLGPPVGTDPASEFLTDLESASLHGRASEALGALSLTVGANTIALYGTASDGRFVSRPFALGRLTAPAPFSLLLTDAAGNTGSSTMSGTITQRGATTGSVAGGTLVVEAYDVTTLLPVAGATVLVDPGLPTRPASPQRQSGVTDPTGRATFVGLASPSHSATVIAAGYHLVSRLDTTAGLVSLPLRPLGAAATAFLGGTVVYPSALGPNASVGCNILDENEGDGRIALAAAGATAIPGTRMRPGRPVVLTAMGGPGTPNDVPTLRSFTINIASVTAAIAASTVQPAPLAAARAGETVQAALALLTAEGTVTNITPQYTVTPPSNSGLDLGNLAGIPDVVIQTTLNGFAGTLPVGRGFTTGTAAAGLTVRGTYSVVPSLAMTPLGPILWSSLTLKDTAGNLGRQRAFNGGLFGFSQVLSFPGIPTVATPGGSFPGSPDVTISDYLTAAPGAFLSLVRVTAVDSAGRQWSVWIADADAAGGADLIPFPEIPAGMLAAGTWKIRAEAWQTLSVGLGITENDFILEDLARLLVTYARSAEVDFTIQ
jgi:hypothetical protein